MVCFLFLIKTLIMGNGSTCNLFLSKNKTQQNRFVSDLVRNSEDRFSHVAAHIKVRFEVWSGVFSMMQIYFHVCALCCI